MIVLTLWTMIVDGVVNGHEVGQLIITSWHSIHPVRASASLLFRRQNSVQRVRRWPQVKFRLPPYFVLILRAFSVIEGIALKVLRCDRMWCLRHRCMLSLSSCRGGSQPLSLCPASCKPSRLESSLKTLQRSKLEAEQL